MDSNLPSLPSPAGDPPGPRYEGPPGVQAGPPLRRPPVAVLHHPAGGQGAGAAAHAHLRDRAHVLVARLLRGEGRLHQPVELHGQLLVGAAHHHHRGKR